MSNRNRSKTREAEADRQFASLQPQLREIFACDLYEEETLGDWIARELVIKSGGKKLVYDVLLGLFVGEQLIGAAALDVRIPKRSSCPLDWYVLGISRLFWFDRTPLLPIMDGISRAREWMYKQVKDKYFGQGYVDAKGVHHAVDAVVDTTFLLDLKHLENLKRHFQGDAICVGTGLMNRTGRGCTTYLWLNPDLHSDILEITKDLERPTYVVGLEQPVFPKRYVYAAVDSVQSIEDPAEQKRRLYAKLNRNRWFQGGNSMPSNISPVVSNRARILEILRANPKVRAKKLTSLLHDAFPGQSFPTKKIIRFADELGVDGFEAMLERVANRETTLGKEMKKLVTPRASRMAEPVLEDDAYRAGLAQAVAVLETEVQIKHEEYATALERLARAKAKLTGFDALLEETSTVPLKTLTATA